MYSQTAALERLKKFLELSAAADAHFEAARDLLGCAPEAPLFANLYAIRDGYMDQVAAAIGDTTGWLSWFVYDNDHGRRGLEAGIDGDMRPIKTAADLLWVVNLSAE